MGFVSVQPPRSDYAPGRDSHLTVNLILRTSALVARRAQQTTPQWFTQPPSADVGLKLSPKNSPLLSSMEVRASATLG